MLTRINIISFLACLVLLIVTTTQYEEFDDDFDDEYSDEIEPDEIDSLISKLEEKYAQSASKKKSRPEAKKIKQIETLKSEKQLSDDFQPNCKRWHLCWHREIKITLMLVKGNA